MTVSISKPAINLRRELGKRVAPYSEQKFYFDNLLINGTFDTDLSGWSANLITWFDGTAKKDSAGTANGNSGSIKVQDFPFKHTFYVVKFDIVNWAAGNVFAGISRTGNSLQSSQQTANFTGNGTYTAVLPAQSTIYVDDTLTIETSTNANLSLDNVSLFESDASGNAIFTMPKGWKPKDVFEDGLLQREGVAHDYEVVFDGFDYVVKPTVAPSATTETHIIGVKS
jgi:hypothetical protein